MDGAEEDTLQRVLSRLQRDKALPLSHIECAALTALLLRRRIDPSNRILSLASPLFRGANYLFVFPDALERLFRLFVENAVFLGSDALFGLSEQCRKIHSAQGRHSLFVTLTGFLEAPAVRRSLVEAAPSARDSFAQVVVYTAYLRAARDGDYRGAFDLLYALDLVYRSCSRGGMEDRGNGEMEMEVSTSSRRQQETITNQEEAGRMRLSPYMERERMKEHSKWRKSGRSFGSDEIDVNERR